MRTFSRLSAAFTVILSTASLVCGHSIARQPLNYFSILDSPSINTPSHRVHAHSEFDITFSLHRNQQRIRLTLEPNHDILAQGAAINYVNENGEVYKTEPFVREEHRVFQGSSWVEAGTKGHWTYAGWARVVIVKDGKSPQFEGAFGLGSDSHHIVLRSNFVQNKHSEDPDLEPTAEEYMVVWRDSDISSSGDADVYTSSLFDGHDFIIDDFSARLARRQSPTNEQRDVTVRADAGSWGSFNARSLFGKRQNSIDGSGTGGNQGVVNLRGAIGNTNGCPTTKKVALMGVAADCTYTKTFNSANDTRDNIVKVVNLASAVYEDTFNITLGIMNLTINDANCPGTASQAAPWNVDCPQLNITQRLTSFSRWRGDQAGNNAFWTLLSNCPTDNEVGLSWTGALCQKSVDPNGGTSANVVMKTSTEWQVIAHEVGHTFGAVHDCDSQTCQQANIVNSQQCCPVSSSGCDAGGQFIMNPYITGNSVNKFSPCTVGNICSAMSVNSVNGSCLVDNSKVPLTTAQQCGNGIVEEGEDCDCGGPEGCGDDSCCDPNTCKFVNGAECDDSNEQCCRSCKFASSGTVCRASTGVCDPQEVCSGTSGSCPADVTAPDGQGCGTNLQCASGQCTSRSLQCKQLLGTQYTDGKNDTYACDQDSCVVRCASPEFGANTCYEINKNFLDGTPCEGDGHCNQGRCDGSTTGGQIRSWIDNNKPLVIGLAAGIGGLLLLSILCCIFSRCRRRKPARRPVKHTGGWAGSPNGPYGQAWPQDNGAQFWQGGHMATNYPPEPQRSPEMHQPYAPPPGPPPPLPPPPPQGYNPAYGPAHESGFGGGNGFATNRHSVRYA